ncbi:hypothetical protein HDU92_003806 [Lobulomyces angularis]|nr:hypothetical protein HDU92_003806 [Lobulomyces angularis]
MKICDISLLNHKNPREFYLSTIRIKTTHHELHNITYNLNKDKLFEELPFDKEIQTSLDLDSDTLYYLMQESSIMVSSTVDFTEISVRMNFKLWMKKVKGVTWEFKVSFQKFLSEVVSRTNIENEIDLESISRPPVSNYTVELINSNKLKVDKYEDAIIKGILKLSKFGTWIPKPKILKFLSENREKFKLLKNYRLIVYSKLKTLVKKKYIEKKSFANQHFFTISDELEKQICNIQDFEGIECCSDISDFVSNSGIIDEHEVPNQEFLTDFTIYNDLNLSKIRMTNYNCQSEYLDINFENNQYLKVVDGERIFKTFIGNEDNGIESDLIWGLYNF